MHPLIITAYYIIAYVFLVILLAKYTISDIKTREIHFNYLLPMHIIMYGIPLSLQSFIVSVDKTPVVTSWILSVFLIVIGIYANILYRQNNTTRPFIGFVDCVVVALICITKPVILGSISTFPVLIFGTLCMICLLWLFPRIKKDWMQRGIPLVLPISISGIICLFL